MLMQSAQPSAGSTAHDGYRVGDAGYRRITVALFAAGVATFALI
jgi:MFS transporter, YNFM family, putative membrane transport protein